jgi:LacI family transcriptional regulator
MILGSTTAAMGAVSAAEMSGRKLGQEIDVVAKEAIRFLKRFRREMIVVQEDVGQAGDFLARAVMAAIERGAPGLSQQLDVPAEVDVDDTDRGLVPEGRTR